jgi:ABC-type phosphate transport system auxiliary subunit
VSKSQLDLAIQEAADAEANRSRLQAEKAQLELELQALKAKRDALQEMANEQ